MHALLHRRETRHGPFDELFDRAGKAGVVIHGAGPCLLYTSDAADERSSVDLGGRRIIKKTKNMQN